MKFAPRPPAIKCTSPTQNRLLLSVALLALCGGAIMWWILPGQHKSSALIVTAAQPAALPKEPSSPETLPSLGGKSVPVVVAGEALPESPPPDSVVTMLPQQAAYLAAALAPNATAQDIRPLIDSAFAPFDRQMNLSVEDAAKLDNLLAQRLEAIKAAVINAVGQGLNVKGALLQSTNQGVSLSGNPAQIGQMVRAAVAPFEGQIRSLIGDAGYQQYKTYAAPLGLAVQTVVAQTMVGPPAGPSQP
jgi:hypothetical protein